MLPIYCAFIMFCPVQTPRNPMMNEKQSLSERSSKSSAEEKEINKVDNVKAYRTVTSSLFPPYSLSNLMSLTHCVLTVGSTLPAVFSILLQVLGKYWHCLLRNLRTGRSSHAEKLQNADHTTKGTMELLPEGTGRAFFMTLLRNTCRLWKCHLASCPSVKRDDNNPRALYLPWLRKRACLWTQRQRQRLPNSCFFPCLAGTNLNQVRPTPALDTVFLYPVSC